MTTDRDKEIKKLVSAFKDDIDPDIDGAIEDRFTDDTELRQELAQQLDKLISVCHRRRLLYSLKFLRMARLSLFIEAGEDYYYREIEASSAKPADESDRCN
ncbi:MAG: hypothetical protein KTR21_11700 [Rhodobacteraceae bacterium]|nr:hypothetical protein [Paracoccaceae bacterium]